MESGIVDGHGVDPSVDSNSTERFDLRASFLSLRKPPCAAILQSKIQQASLSKSLPVVNQLRLFRVLMNDVIFDIVADALQSEDKRLVLIGTDILFFSLTRMPTFSGRILSDRKAVHFLDFW
ncbi:uncharacterized protein LOC113299086 [Papaver somniferum]|uniref:uncharacterized protein LOC113299086 n=1 Tax=Papaver somniferum TaxID=3469 RepID=UPI000E6F6D02|nr:uncharacterized protein LOC113299086 [Papaver somniferum]